MILETKHLKIIPLDLRQFRLLLDSLHKMEKDLSLMPSGIYLDDHLQKAMESLYAMAMNHQDDYIWLTSWQIILKPENKAIGSASFKNLPNESGIVEVGYGINPDYQGRGYMTEALHAICRWALTQPQVNGISAETERYNQASQQVLMKCGFVRNEKPDNNLWWILNKKTSKMKVISIRENPQYKDVAIKYLQSKWPSVLPIMYEDSVNHSLTSPNPLPQWYLLEKDDAIIGCAGLITNDFVSRMDLYPWLCAVFIDEQQRGNAYSSLLFDKAKADTAKAGFEHMYLTTEHIGFYEKFGFSYIGQGYHPWGDESRIYKIRVKDSSLAFTIRQETKENHNEVYNLIKTAFTTAKVKDGDEQDFAVGLRNGENFIPELSLIAEHNGKFIGHIMFTRSYVIQPNGNRFESLLVAPVSVALEYREKGVGSAMIRDGFKRAKELGYKAAFLCGDPAYYHRFGFKPTSSFGIKPKGDIPEQYVMACELEEGALSGINGITDIC